jgi:hypothetical protein
LFYFSFILHVRAALITVPRSTSLLELDPLNAALPVTDLSLCAPLLLLFFSPIPLIVPLARY